MLGQTLKEIREKRDYSVKELAGLCGVNASYISKIEAEKRIPSLAVLLDIANALDVSVGYVLFMAEIKEGKTSHSNMDDFFDHLANTVSFMNYTLGHRL